MATYERLWNENLNWIGLYMLDALTMGELLE